MEPANADLDLEAAIAMNVLADIRDIGHNVKLVGSALTIGTAFFKT